MEGGNNVPQMQWIKVDKSAGMPLESPFLLRDEYGYVYEGCTAFDYYDAEYWFPMPALPHFPNCFITNDEWLMLALRDKPGH